MLLFLQAAEQEIEQALGRSRTRRDHNDAG
jgi:hypothetical protein